MSSAPEPPPEVAPAAAALLARAPALAEGMARRIRAQVTYYGSAERVPSAELLASCRRNAELVLGQLAHGRGAGMESARRTGREGARRGVPLAELLHAYRVGSEYLWSALAAEVCGADGVTVESVTALAAWWVREGLAAASGDAYREAATEMALQRERERSALAEALFTGMLTDRTTLWEAAHALGLPTEGPYVVVAAEVPAPGREALPGVEPRLRAEDARSAWRLLPGLQVGVVALPGPDAEEAVLGVLGRSAASRVGVSPPYRPLRETPRALRLARLALAGAAGAAPGVARFAESPVSLLVAAAPEEAARAADTVLARVRALPPAERDRLLDTLERWFAGGGSAAAAARLLYCHPNTVRYRLRRLEDLTGRSLSDPRSVADLAVALCALRLLPADD
ncbi:PucR family transcriptional regulator [Streptomyces caatingaensis]|uniref:Transcriptional regulator, Fis family protein n=1 Tax=Streptomyces caatingaensis TaxID=1678637 RepID=A0A0K9X810_9ACTN|nr:helix-turn-helix domain-containing protein [Streptomyces caatingaensis]KNB49211.1 transcriptional regulator, Fis family protein [Streptomyces caatingaensis]